MDSPRVHIRGYFDFLCPWCYIGKIRLEKAIRIARVKAEVEWIPFELYAHHENHAIHREHIAGNEHLDTIYQQLSLVAAEEKIIIRQHPYAKSSRRALTGVLFARTHGKMDEYLRDVYAEVFEYGNDASSLMVLGRIALKVGWNVEEFLRFINEKKNHDQLVHESETAKHAGVHGVPTYVINGYTLAGTIPSHELSALLREHARTISVSPATRHSPKKKTRASTPSRKKAKQSSKKTLPRGKSVSSPKRRSFPLKTPKKR